VGHVAQIAEGPLKTVAHGIEEGTESRTLRGVMAVGFRQRKLIANAFLGILSIAVVIAFLVPRKYVAELKILVTHERTEPPVSLEHETSVQWQTPVSEEELRSEVELIRSRDVIGTVVAACDLEDSARSIWNKDTDTEDQALARGIARLEEDLTVEPIKQTNLIRLLYKSADSHLAARVLNSLAALYLEKHVETHRAPGQFEFFRQKAEEYRKALANTEQGLINFSREQGVVNPGLEKEISLRKLAEFDAESRAARASIAEGRQRIHALESQLATLPQRETSEVRTSDNPELMQNLNSKLLELQLKRTELSSKFAPNDRPVQEVGEQIAQTRAAIEAAEKAPLRYETTDRDPTYEALRTELAKAKTELAATEARAAAVSSLIRTYRTESEHLDRQEFLHKDMLRTAKSEEENYLLYLRKEEEARISDALERQRFSNVVVAEPAAVPFKPQVSRLLIVTLGAILAALVSLVAGFVADRWDPSFRTPEELESFLDSPVVAAFPKSGD
jgi:uncharacterized protein involved in exopolysaccharide biosynthesis